MAQLFSYEFSTEESHHNKSSEIAVLSLIIERWIVGSANASFSLLA